MGMNAIETQVRAIQGAVFCKVDYATPNHALLKTSKVDGSINPFWTRKDDIRKVVTNAAINLGVIYGNALNGRLERKDIEPNFVAQPMKGKVEHTFKHKNLCQSIDGSKTYVRYMAMPTKGMTVQYMLDGNDITDQIGLYKKVNNPVQTQTDAGLSEDEQIVWRTLDIANITALRVLGNEVTN